MQIVFSKKSLRRITVKLLKSSQRCIEVYEWCFNHFISILKDFIVSVAMQILYHDLIYEFPSSDDNYEDSLLYL